MSSLQTKTEQALNLQQQQTTERFSTLEEILQTQHNVLEESLSQVYHLHQHVTELPTRIAQSQEDLKQDISQAFEQRIKQMTKEMFDDMCRVMQTKLSQLPQMLAQPQYQNKDPGPSHQHFDTNKRGRYVSPNHLQAFSPEATQLGSQSRHLPLHPHVDNPGRLFLLYPDLDILSQSGLAIVKLIFGRCCRCLVISMFAAKYGHVEAVDLGGQ